MLLGTYAKCIDGQEHDAKKKIETVFGAVDDTGKPDLDEQAMLE